MEKILIVEDDNGILDFLSTELLHEGFDVKTAEDGRTALEIFEKENFSLVLLDVMLPFLSGLEVLRRIRKKSGVPVILLTARGETDDKVSGLDAGADDYLAKPFEIEELLARIRSLLRRSNLGAKKNLVAGDLELVVDSMQAKLFGNHIELSKTEFLILRFFMENCGKVFSREQIIDAVWGENHFIEKNAVDVYVGYLRTKIDKVANKKFIQTVRGAGYVFENPKSDKTL